jgi:hypothetical protein
VISARKVICPKNKRGVQGSRDYSWHHVAATAALPKLFGVAKHYRTKNADGELSYKYKDIQSEYVGNLDKLKLFRNAWKRLTCSTLFSFLSGRIQWLLVLLIVGVTGRVKLRWKCRRRVGDFSPPKRQTCRHVGAMSPTRHRPCRRHCTVLAFRTSCW